MSPADPPPAARRRRGAGRASSSAVALLVLRRLGCVDTAARTSLRTASGAARRWPISRAASRRRGSTAGRSPACSSTRSPAAPGHGYGPGDARRGADARRRPARRPGACCCAGPRRARGEHAAARRNDDRAGNPLELFAVASAYRWAERNLAGDADWERRRGGAAGLPAALGVRARWARARSACFASPTCWNNYKIVDAAATLLLLDTGLEPASPRALLADPERARAAAVSVLERDLADAIGGRAEARGRARHADRPRPARRRADLPAGLPRDVGRGARARAAGARGRRAARGRASTSVARCSPARRSRRPTATSPTWAARRASRGRSGRRPTRARRARACSRASHPRSAGMCATLAARSVGRLRRLHPFNEGLMPIVPRLGYGALISRRARALRARDDVQRPDGDVPGVGERGGGARPTASSRRAAARPRRRRSSIPTRARLAVVRRDGRLVRGPRRSGRRWSTTCATTSACCRSRCARATAGSTSSRRGRSTRDQGRDSAGPSLVTPAGLGVPARHGASRSTPERGEVVVRGGFRTADEGVGAARGGVPLRARAARRHGDGRRRRLGSQLRYQDFLPAGWTEADRGLARAADADVRSSALASRPSSVEDGVDLRLLLRGGPAAASCAT